MSSHIKPTSVFSLKICPYIHGIFHRVFYRNEPYYWELWGFSFPFKLNPELSIGLPNRFKKYFLGLLVMQKRISIFSSLVWQWSVKGMCKIWFVKLASDIYHEKNCLRISIVHHTYIYWNLQYFAEIYWKLIITTR